MRKVAIIGRCDNTRGDAPWHDPEWEKWGLAWDMGFAGDRYYETHTRNTWHDNMVSNRITYTQWLQEFAEDKPDDKLVLLKEAMGPDFETPNVLVYPMEEVAKVPMLCIHGTEDPYLESSIGYMLSQAYIEEVDKTGIYGVDLTSEDEYTYQRPNMCYLVGALRFSGVPVAVPKASALWELRELDNLHPDYLDENIPRHRLEYCLGRDRALGKCPAKIRSDLMTSGFENPPRYGYVPLSEEIRFGKRVFLDKGGQPLERVA